MFYGALLLTGVNLLLRLISTGFQVYVSGRIGAAGVGLLQLVLSVGALAMTAGMAGVRTAAMYLTAEAVGRREKAGLRRIVRCCIGYSLLFSLPTAAALSGFSPLLATRWIGDAETAGAIRLLALFLPVSCLCGVLSGCLTGLNRIGTLAAVQAAEQLLTMSLTFLLLSGPADDRAVSACRVMVLASGIGACLTLLALAILCAAVLPRQQAAARVSVSRHLAGLALPLALADDLKAGISTAENLLVPRRLSLFAGEAAPLAAFGTVCGMVFPLMMLPAALLYGFAELVVPELARCRAAGSHARIHHLISRSLRTALLYGVTCGGLLYLLAGPLCGALYHSEEAARHLRRFAFLVPMLYCDAVTDAMTKGLGQQKICVRYNILTSALDVALLYVLLPRWGMTGYFLSFLVTHALNFVLSLRRLLRISGETLTPFVPLATVAVMLLAVRLTAMAPHPLLRAAAYPALLYGGLVLLGIVGREDFRWGLGLLRGSGGK